MGESFLEPAELWQFFPTSICRTSKLSVISGWKYASRQERGHGSGNMEIVGNIGSPRKRPPPAAGIPLRDLLVLPAHLKTFCILQIHKYNLRPFTGGSWNLSWKLPLWTSVCLSIRHQLFPFYRIWLMWHFEAHVWSRFRSWSIVEILKLKFK